VLRRLKQSHNFWRSFAENDVYHASVGPEALGKSYIDKDNIRRGVQAFFGRYPDGKFENSNRSVSASRVRGRPV
jgi:hypothetical protein